MTDKKQPADKNIKVTSAQLDRFDDCMKACTKLPKYRTDMFEIMLKSYENTPVKNNVTTLVGTDEIKKVQKELELTKQALAEANQTIVDTVIANNKLKNQIKEHVEFERKNTKYFPTKHSIMIDECRDSIVECVEEIN